MQQACRVFKFGGSSLKDAQHIENVAQILKDYSSAEPLLVVVSAMGKTTNALEKVVQAHAQQTGEAHRLLKEVKTFHFGISEQLLGANHPTLTELDRLISQAQQWLSSPAPEQYDFLYDQLVSLGELLSSKLVTNYLNHRGLSTTWLDARKVVKTDQIFREGWVQWPETMAHCNQLVKPLLRPGHFVLTQGFIGSTIGGETTTLGREGSDYTAAIFSYCLDANDMTIWKDVPGVLTGDPRIFDNVSKIDRLSYKEAIEMTYYGAKVIHPKTIKPLQNKSIPLYVKSYIDPTGSGTCISSDVNEQYPPMVAVEQNQALLNISTKDFSFVAEHHMSYLFKVIAELRLQVNMMQNTAISFAVCFNDSDDKVERFIEQIKDEFNVVLDRNLELITVRHYLNHVLEALKAGKIVLLEERLPNTVQMVVKHVPLIKRKDNPDADYLLDKR